MGLNFPASPTVGQLHPDPVQAGVPQYKWDGGAWITNTPQDALAAPRITTADVPPTPAYPGDLWWESDSGLLYIYYYDGTSSQWVIASPFFDEVRFVKRGGDTMTGDLTPAVNGVGNLGSSTLRWGTVFTMDLDLKNGIGDWTLVEGEDDLFLYNNKKNRTYKFALIEVDPATVPAKKA